MAGEFFSTIGYLWCAALHTLWGLETFLLFVSRFYHDCFKWVQVVVRDSVAAMVSAQDSIDPMGFGFFIHPCLRE